MVRRAAGLGSRHGADGAKKRGVGLLWKIRIPALRLLLERAVKQGTITQEEYDQVAKASQARARAAAPDFKMWYDKGFNFSFNDNAFFLKIRAMTQLRYTHWDQNSLCADVGGFQKLSSISGRVWQPARFAL